MKSPSSSFLINRETSPIESQLNFTIVRFLHFSKCFIHHICWTTTTTTAIEKEKNLKSKANLWENIFKIVDVRQLVYFFKNTTQDVGA